MRHGGVKRRRSRVVLENPSSSHVGTSVRITGTFASESILSNWNRDNSRQQLGDRKVNISMDLKAIVRTVVAVVNMDLK